MTGTSIPVDLFNPGQVFACLGFLEAAEVLLGQAEGGFDWGDGTVKFVLKANADSNPFTDVLAFLAEAQIEALVPLASGRTDNGNAPTFVDSNGTFPVPPKVKEGNKRIWIKESALPIRLIRGEDLLSVSHWADTENGREPIKTWGGAAGKSGASRMRDLLNAARSAIQANIAFAASDPFAIAAPVGGFRLEMRRDYVPMDIGFSPNKHQSTMSILGFPIVEILAVIGLENARPSVINRLSYRYAVWRGLLTPSLARPLLGCMRSAIDTRTFAARLGEPNEYDRSILYAVEEPNP